MTTIQTAWDLIGDEGSFRILGGRTVYEAVEYVSTEESVKLAYLAPTDDGIRQVSRYVHPETPIEVLRNFTKEAEQERAAELAELREIYG